MTPRSLWPTLVPASPGRGGIVSCDGIGRHRRLNGAEQPEPTIERNPPSIRQAYFAAQVLSLDAHARVEFDRISLGHDKIVDP